MPFKFKTKVMIGEGDEAVEHEVEVTAPDGAVDAEELKDKYSLKAETEVKIKERLKDVATKTKDDLLEDPEFQKLVLEKLGVNPDGTAKEVQAAVAKAKAEWEGTTLQSEKERADKAETKAKGLVDQQIGGLILAQAARVGVLDKFTGSNSDKPAPVVVMSQSDFEYDEEHEQWAIIGADGKKRFDPNGTESKPYMSVAQYFDEFAADVNNKPYMKDEAQRGPKIDESGHEDKGEGKTIDARDPAQMGANLKEVASGKTKAVFTD